jgi:23S rRNA C2498 (ribose-2'-O)-methylase RlmM
MNDVTNSTLDSAEQLRQALEQHQALSEKIDALRAETREADLEETKRLCKLHGFTATDLRSSLKTKGAARTPRKSSNKSR